MLATLEKPIRTREQIKAEAAEIIDRYSKKKYGPRFYYRDYPTYANLKFV